MGLSTFHDSTCMACGVNPAEDYDLYEEYAGFSVCFKCKQASPELYKRISKGTLQKDYLLGDHDIMLFDLKFVEKPNPKGSNYARMKLFLRCEAQAAAIKKYGSLAELEEEKHRRKNAVLQKRESVYEKRLRELKRASLGTEAIQLKSLVRKHVHQFKDAEETHDVLDDDKKLAGAQNHTPLLDGNNLQVKRCTICGLQISLESF